MSMYPQDLGSIPAETARIARAANPKGTLAMWLRDELGAIYRDEEFADLYPERGQPALSPWRLAVVTVLQYVEDLTDRQAAEAVRERIDWKYLLGLELSDAGFDASVLTEWRGRLSAQGAEERLLESVLVICRERGWLKAGGKMRTDATHVLAAARSLHHLETVGETLRAVLEDLAQEEPDWLLRQGYTRVHACLEATSTYSDAVAHFLYAQGHQVSLANPARVAAFRTSEGIRTKTDRHDALVLARFCAQKRPALWCPTPPAVHQLQVLLAHLDDLLAMHQQERNRLENLRLDALTRQSLLEHIGWLQSQCDHTLQRAAALVEQTSALAAPCAHLDSIPGIAQLTAMRLYSVFFDLQRFNRAPKLVAHAGLCAAEENSGTSVHRRASISKGGNAQIRKWLYLSALSLLRYDRDFVRWAGELKARGKSNKVIIVAIMRKVLHIVHGVLKSGQDYDPRKAFPSHYGLAPHTKEDVPAT